MLALDNYQAGLNEVMIENSENVNQHKNITDLF